MPGEKKGSKKKEEKTCEYRMHDYKPCGRKLHDDEHCIFHSKDIEGKKEKFNDPFWKEFERQKMHGEFYDFNGFVFPGNISFRGKTFEKSANFEDTQFLWEANFSGAKFSGDAKFGGARFSGDAKFGNTQFSGAVEFPYTQFSGDVEFPYTQFSGHTYFGDTQFYGVANFQEAQFYGVADFGTVKFDGAAHFNKAKFKEEANFENIKIEKYSSFYMLDTYFSNVSGLFESIEDNKKKFKYSNKTEFLPDNFYLILGEKTTARYPIISREIRDDMYLLRFKEKHPKMHFIWWLFADCGRSFSRWALWSFGFAIAFAFIYYSFYTDYMLNFQTVYISEDFPLFSFIYYSIVTFTTLGFGDIVPRTGWLQFWVMLEVILGYIMLGGLISILANKLARRS